MRRRKHPDPEYQRWRRKYPRFPGVAECVRLIKARKAHGAWADFIAQELADNAVPCLPELIEAYRTNSSEDVRLYVMMALDIAQPSEAVAFLAEVLREGDPKFTIYAVRALEGMDTREARSVLWRARHAEPFAADGTSNADSGREKS